MLLRSVRIMTTHGRTGRLQRDLGAWVGAVVGLRGFYAELAPQAAGDFFADVSWVAAAREEKKGGMRKQRA